MTKLGLAKFEAKIGQGNEPSIRMFQKLHFEQVRMSPEGETWIWAEGLLVLGLVVVKSPALISLALAGGCEQRLPGGDTQTDDE